MKRPLGLAVILFLFWLLWSGYWDSPLLLGLGVVSCIAVVIIVWRMGLIDDEGVPVQIPLRAVVYLPWLFWQILKSNIDVAGRILRPRMPIHPHVLVVEAGQKTDLGRAIYANSITLTPGTVSVDIEGNRITVHALSREAAEGVRDGSMDRMVTWYEGLS